MIRRDASMVVHGFCKKKINWYASYSHGGCAWAVRFSIAYLFSKAQHLDSSVIAVLLKKVINLEVKCQKNVWWILQRASTIGYLRIVRTVATY